MDPKTKETDTKSEQRPSDRPDAGELTDKELDNVAAGAIATHYTPQKPDGGYLPP